MATTKGKLRRFQNHEVTLNNFGHWSVHSTLFIASRKWHFARKEDFCEWALTTWYTIMTNCKSVLEERVILQCALVVLNMTQNVFCNPAMWRQNYCKSETRYETNVLLFQENGILQGNWFKGCWDWACKSSKTSLQAQMAIGRTLITATRMCSLQCLDQIAITAKFWYRASIARDTLVKIHSIANKMAVNLLKDPSMAQKDMFFT